MKKRYATFFLLSFVIIANLHAQTLKNIHRHDLPTLQIPVELIDKVEAVDLGGTKTLRISKLFGEATQIPVAEIDSITHYIGSVNPEQLGEMRTASVMGVVRDAGNVPIMNAIVRSPYGGEETRTDPNGVFFLNDIIVYDKLGYIIITKPFFHKASRSFLPLESGSNRVNVELLPMTQSGSFTASSGGTVTSGLLQLSFPANAITLNGQPYSGIVNVYATALDPSSPEVFDQMPGELLGGMNDSLRLLRSFGMAAVELRDANMNELQLAEGSSATLTFNIPLALQADAPNIIDWWSFDENFGYWKHEGEAQKQGNTYVGEASHFSWWNVDFPQFFNNIYGTVISTDGEPVSNALINLVSDTLGTASALTNALGEFSGRVPMNVQLPLSIFLYCSSSNSWDLAYSGNVVSMESTINESYSVAINSLYPVSGNVVNCSNQIVESGYVIMDLQIQFLENGEFVFHSCELGQHTIIAFDTSFPDSLIGGIPDTIYLEPGGVNIGELYACSQFFSTVSDFDGNSYQTVLIGTNWWMAENLNTMHFSEGSEIQNVTDASVWGQSSGPALCNYNNNAAFSQDFGKLYNWFTVTDSRNVCPSGWHVPSQQDWNLLINDLGGSGAGGKMKTTNIWETPNYGATNESGFSGLPAGNRVSNGIFTGVNFNGSWWSSSSFGGGYAYFLLLSFDSSEANLIFDDKLSGFSIRCVKD